MKQKIAARSRCSEFDARKLQLEIDARELQTKSEAARNRCPKNAARSRWPRLDLYWFDAAWLDLARAVRPSPPPFACLHAGRRTPERITIADSDLHPPKLYV